MEIGKVITATEAHELTSQAQEKLARILDATMWELIDKDIRIAADRGDTMAAVDIRDFSLPKYGAEKLICALEKKGYKAHVDYQNTPMFLFVKWEEEV